MNDTTTGSSPAPSVWQNIVGPVYQVETLPQKLDKTVEEVSYLQEHDMLILLTTADGYTVCPTFQFDTNQ